MGCSSEHIIKQMHVEKLYFQHKHVGGMYIHMRTPVQRHASCNIFTVLSNSLIIHEVNTIEIITVKSICISDTETLFICINFNSDTFKKILLNLSKLP